MAEEKLETFEDKMNFLAKDEQEAIDGYDKVIALLDAEKDAIVIEQLNKIKVEEEAHKKYLEDVKENHDLVYTEPLEQEEVTESADFDNWISVAFFTDKFEKEIGDGYLQFNKDDKECSEVFNSLTFDKLISEIDKNSNFYVDDVDDIKNISAIIVDKMGGDDIVETKTIYKDETIHEGAEGHRVPGKEYVIYEIDDKAKKAPIVAIRKTYTEAQYFCNKDENFTRELGIEEVPVGKFKKGDDFYGPFDSDWNLIEAKKESKTEYIEMPHEVYTTKEDIIRVNKELEEKAKAGQLIGIRKEPKMLMLAEPAINGIWTIYLTDEGFIEKIVVF